MCLQCRRPCSIPGLRRSTGEGIGYPPQDSWVSLVTQLVKDPPAMQETWVRSLGWEDPLEKGKVTHSSILAWKIPWTVHGVTKSRTRLSDFHSLGLFGGSVTQLVPFPSLGCKRVPWTEGSGEHGPWKHEEAGLRHAFSHLLPPLQPHFRCTSSGFLRSPKSDQSSISSPPLLCRNVTVFISLLTSLHFFSASGTVLGLGRIRWEDLVQALRKVVVWEEVFSGPFAFQHCSTPLLCGASLGWVARMLHFRPEFWASCQCFLCFRGVVGHCGDIR